MGTIKISALVDESVWDEFKAVVMASNQDISLVVGKAISEYVQRRRLHLGA